mmetsp:Transcript_13814/g.27317  ORF Transcript_13814/g.27317 Transcript_13814/m.27317 type:complete len:272 (+) Transcript_13814:118-933(+)
MFHLEEKDSREKRVDHPKHHHPHVALEGVSRCTLLRTEHSKRRPGDARSKHGPKEGSDAPQGKVLGAVILVGQARDGQSIVRSEVHPIARPVAHPEGNDEWEGVHQRVADVDPRHARAGGVDERLVPEARGRVPCYERHHAAAALREDAQDGGICLSIRGYCGVVHAVAKVVQDVDLSRHGHVVASAGAEDPEEVPMRLDRNIVRLPHLVPLVCPRPVRHEDLLLRKCPGPRRSEQHRQRICPVRVLQRQQEPEPQQPHHRARRRHPPHDA